MSVVVPWNATSICPYFIATALILGVLYFRGGGRMLRKQITVFTLLLASFLLASCGGGGSSGTMTAAPSDLQYPTPPAFVTNTAIAPLTPTVVGEVTSYSVSPGLPAGLSLNTTTGVMSGTPTGVAAKTNYTVKAINAGGSTTAIVSIVVNATAPSIAYGSSYYGFTANVTAQPITPTVSGGAVVSWAISPALPAGLVFDTTDGSISGTPTAAAAASMHTVTATNSGGQSKATVTLAIAAAPLIDLGHSSEVELIRYANTSLISVDEVGHWVLQTYGSGAILASGDGACSCSLSLGGVPIYPPVDVAGTTAIDNASSGIEVRSAASGQLLATIPGEFSWFKLASDGSYIATGNATALTAWSTAGQALLTLAGDYSKAIAFSALGQIQVALGPAGTNVIQTIAVPSGTSSVSPTFQGVFNSWFVDGARFFTNTGATVWTYSSAGVQQDITQLTSDDPFLVGQGNWFWTFGSGSTLDIYKVGASTSPAFTDPVFEPTAIASGMTIGVLEEDSNQLTVIDLSGATPVSANYTLPIDSFAAYAAISPSSWVVGNGYGVIFDGASLGGQPRYLTLGQAVSIAAGTEYFSVATASGEILYFDANTDAMSGTVNFASSQLAMSSDGTVLAAAALASPLQNPPDTHVNVYSLPSATLINSFPFGPGFPVEISLSGTGTVLAMVPSSTSGCDAEVIAVTGGTPIWCATTGTPDTVQISPDGTLVAASTAPSRGGTTTTIYTNGALTTAVNGWVVGWLDNTRLLAEQFGQENMNPEPVYEGADIFSPSGTNLGAAYIPQLQTLQAVTSDSIYSPQTNTIMSVTTRATSWASADTTCPDLDSACPFPNAGAVTGSQVIFSSGALVLAQPY
jgi:hypothetical protein